jgi:SAM-dependent methyltransferase
VPRNPPESAGLCQVVRRVRGESVHSKNHWQRIYRTQPATEASWYQRNARVSLGLIDRIADPYRSTVLDVGGGASTLVDGLIERDYEQVTVLDIVPEALEVAQARLGTAAERVTWVAADVLTHPFVLESVDVWHDRALFHFLTSPNNRNAYLEQVIRAVRPGGHVILATFGKDGPTRCSGLGVRRYGPEEMQAEFGPSFTLLDVVQEGHVTPSGGIQAFQYFLLAHRPLRRRATM